MTLQELLKDVPVLAVHAKEEQTVTALCYDSRQVQAGSVFVAIEGFCTDGHRFIPQALASGASVIVCQRPPEQKIDYVLVESSRLALAQLSANWFGHPAKQMKLIGVTGTNGKTSVTTILKSVLEQTVGAKVGLIGTIANQIGDQVIPTERTTPESYEVQRLLAQMAEAGCTHVVMEVSSHALALQRVAGMEFDVGVFTNLTEDHLDFHKTMEEYAKAKAILFGHCNRSVCNFDDPYAQQMIASAKGEVCTFSLEKPADLRGSNVELKADGVELDVKWKQETCHAKIGIPGTFTAYNLLAVMGAGLMLGIPLPDLAAALEKARGVAGRMEVVPTFGAGFTVIIDYAHTPDALENVLKSVRSFCKGRLITVFGCGGDRDPIKRPIMGRIGVEGSDLAVITSDNPRTEKPDAIIKDILQGVKDYKKDYQVIENRREAIAWAVEQARPDDLIVLAGKGHETYQIIGTKKQHFDEREEVAKALSQRLQKDSRLERITLRQAALWCSGTVAPQFEEMTFAGATMDTREIQPGQLFVAVAGEKRDGHDFAAQAICAGAAAVLAQKKLDASIPAIYVPDTLKALGELGRVCRRQRGLTVVGITGSVGKTTTKEMTASILQTTYPTARTSRNFNNHIGLPLTILNAKKDCRMAVLEMGMNHFGEMSYLTSIATPDIAVITNIGTMHIENLGSRQGILEAKLEILEGLQPGGRAVFNGDEPMLWNLKAARQPAPVYFGIHNPECQVRAYDVEQSDGGISFGVRGLGQDFHLYLPVEGEHNVYDALAAITVGMLLKVKSVKIQEALATFRNTGMRQKIYEQNGFTIIEDCYNAGPESMEAALSVLAAHKTRGRRIAVLGDMLELGACSGAEHYRIGRLSVGQADLIFTYGKNGDRVISGAVTGGMDKKRLGSFTTHEALCETLVRLAKPGDVLLFKGSRGMKMEHVLQLFLEQTTPTEK